MNEKRFPLMKIHVVFSAVFIIALVLDRITKIWASSHLISEDVSVWDGVLKFHYLENQGAAWGLFQNAFWLFYIITAVAVVVMAIIYARIPFTKRYHFLRFLLVMLCAGAVGNFIDRACYHYVVDFICVEFINFPVFNVADIYVTVSVFLIVIALFFKYSKDDDLWKKKA